MNALPVVGWILSFIGCASLAVPFWIVWTSCGLGSFYFGEFIPERFAVIPFWHCVGLFMVVSVFKTLMPKIVSVSQSNTNKDS